MAASTGTGDNGGTVSVPPPDYTEQARQTADGLKQGGFWERFFGVKTATAGGVVAGALKSLASLADEVVAGAVTILDGLQATNTQGFFDLTAAVLSDILGVEVSSSAFKSGFQQGGDPGGLRAIGGSLYDFLVSSFSSGGAATPQSGVSAAKAFLGYLTAFSIRQGNISLLTSMIPEEFRVADGIASYAEAMEKALALGRLARVAFTPLIKILIADPLTYALNAQYRPKLLAEAQYVKALQRGVISRDTFNTQMGYLGYQDSDLDTVIADLSKLLAAAELSRLLRYGEATVDDATSALSSQGFSPGDAQLALINEDLARADAWTQKELELYVKQVQDGTASISDVESNINSLPLGDLEKQAILHYLGALVEFPRRLITLAEIEDAYLRGVADLSEVEAVLAQQGYSQIDAMTLELILLDKQKNDQAKAALAAQKCAARKAAAAAKGKPQPIC